MIPTVPHRSPERTEHGPTVPAAGEAPNSTPLAPFASLVQLAIASDDPAPVVAAAQPALGCPLGLAGSAGEELAHAPDNEDGTCAVAIARTVARRGLAAPRGWRVLRLTQSTAPLGVLAARTKGTQDPSTSMVLELVAALLSDVLKRAALQRSHVAGLVRRLTSDQRLPVEDVRREAREIGLRLSEAYWPGLLTWRETLPPERTIELLEETVSRLETPALTVAVGNRLVLLYPADGAPPAGLSPERWFRQVAHEARRLVPSSRAQVLVAQRSVPLSRLAVKVAELDDLLRAGPRADDSQLVIEARQFALDRLLTGAIPRAEASGFIDAQLGSLLAWDRQHRTDLLAVVEAALDFPRHDQAARRCFMHRNTFRHRLRQATEVLGHDLDDAELRLAVHVALKLRRILGGGGPENRLPF